MSIPIQVSQSKMELVSVSLEGAVLNWFNTELVRKPFLDWRNFKERLIARHSKVKIRDPSQPRFAITHNGSIEEYMHFFEDLSSQVSGFRESQLEGIFMNGLKPEMREVVNMCKPIDLPEMVSVALQMESSSLYRVVSRDMSLEHKKHAGGYHNTWKTNTEPSS